MADRQYPRQFAHVGVTVPDVEEALRWYEDVLGWTRLKESRTTTGNEGYGGKRAVDVLGKFESMRVAHLVTGNGIGVELFEFAGADSADPTPSETDAGERTDPKRPGLFHICVVDPDVEGLADRIDRSGGDHYAEVWRLYEDSDEYRLTYCRDPFGNLIEIYSHGHELMHAATPDASTDD